MPYHTFHVIAITLWLGSRTRGWHVMSSSLNAAEYSPTRGIMHIKSVVTESPSIGTVWWFEVGSVGSGGVLVTWSWSKIIRSEAVVCCD
ncbi:hypothetical protein TNCV_1173291 [Trichonephila clavipes]|uniref:Secreted protein n=1 Tax=Trichonephila clavipes TaxID=2585209 RepID=A0A8X6RZ34_TRICX|nr:hypothetical protein TNCV_1173291 [Trichonephila clavipes]